MRAWLIVVSVTIAAATSLGAVSQDRRQGQLIPGGMAIDFTLEPRGGGPPITLSSFRGVKPVALVFGSYT